MVALVHDRVAAGEQQRSGRRRCPAPAGGGRPCPRRSGSATDAAEMGSGRWRGPLAVFALVALTALGGAVADVVVGVAGDRLPPSVESSSSPASPSSAASLTAGAVHIVQPGETYWSIAQAVGGSADIRDRVEAFREANGGELLQAGDRLAVTLPD